MKKILALSVSVLALGLLTGCEDKVAQEQQNQKIETALSETARMRGEIEELKMDNSQLKQKINLVTDYIRKKIEEDKAKAAASVAKPAATTAKAGASKAAPAPVTTKKKTTGQ